MPDNCVGPHRDSRRKAILVHKGVVSIQSVQWHGGTGLGLAIVKHIVNRHRAALDIESEIGKGTTFAVFLLVAEG